MVKFTKTMFLTTFASSSKSTTTTAVTTTNATASASTTTKRNGKSNADGPSKSQRPEATAVLFPLPQIPRVPRLSPLSSGIFFTNPREPFPKIELPDPFPEEPHCTMHCTHYVCDTFVKRSRFHGKNIPPCSCATERRFHAVPHEGVFVMDMDRHS